MANLDFPGTFKGPEELVAAAAPQDFTAAWASVGEELYVQGARRLALWAQIDINDSTDVRFRLRARLTTAGTEYVLPIRTVSPGVVAIEDEYVELTDDADQNIVISWDLDGLAAYVLVETMAGAVGAAAGQIDAASVTTAL